MSISIFLVLFLSFLNLSNAEIRIVRGGGLAEMQVISINQNIDNYIRICFRESNPCQLSQQAAIELTAVYNSHKQDILKYSIQFSSQVINGHFSRENSLILISSHSIYRPNGEPNDFHNLFAFVLALRLELSGSVNSFDYNLNLANKLFRSLSQFHRAIQIPWLNNRMIIHSYEYTFGSFRLRNFYIEDAERTIDLTSMISKALPCGTVENWNFSSWKFSSDASTLYLFSNVSSSCSQLSRNTQKIVVHVNLTADKKIRVETIRVSLSY